MKIKLNHVLNSIKQISALHLANQKQLWVTPDIQATLVHYHINGELPR